MFMLMMAKVVGHKTKFYVTF